MDFSVCCDTCANCVYDEQQDEYFCNAYMDEDEYAALLKGRQKGCPYYNPYDEYKIVRKQN